MTREEELAFIAGRPLGQLRALRSIAARLASEPGMPQPGVQSAQRKMADIDREIARREAEHGTGAAA